VTTAPLRVLFLAHSYPRVPGDAAGSFLWHLAVALRAEQVKVRVVAPHGDDLPAHDVFDGIRVDRFRYAPRRYENLAYTGNMATEVQRSWSAKLALLGFMGSGFALAARVRREFEPDLVHAHWWFPGGLAGTWVAGLGDIPLVTTMHGTDVRLARANTVARPLMRYVLRHSAASTTVSSWLADEVESMLPGGRPQVAPMPVSTSLFAPAPGVPRARLLFVGRLNQQKGIADLIEALALTTSSIGLDVIGDGPDREQLLDRSRVLGVGDRIQWLGARPQHELPAAYQRAVALIVPSTGEGLGLVSVEAQLCETPVIGYASGGITDTVRHDETGLLVPPGDTRALAAAIDKLVGNPALATHMGRAGRMATLGAFSPESVARRYATLYRGVVDRPL
jgi:glycosyltransferase involved in cell wall biosynthesis